MRGLAHQIFEYLRQHAWLGQKPKAKKRPYRKLHLEALEDRFLPATSINQAIPATLTGTAFVDSNNNGIFDKNELALPGATVTLKGTDNQGHSVTATAVTNANGVYSILQLNPGTYQVSLTTNSNFILGKSSAGSAGGIVSGTVVSAITITEGETLVGYNLGVSGLSAQSYSLRYYMASTLYVNGFPVYAINNQTPVSAAGTGVAYADGPAPPAGITPVLTAVGTGSLTGFVKDVSGNAIANVTVALTGITSGGANAGLPVNKTTTTDSTGAYTFATLAAGSYSINVASQPAGFRAGVPTVGNLNGFIKDNNLIAGVDVTTTAGSGYGFTELPVTEPTGSAPAMEAHLVNDTAGNVTASTANGPGGAASDGLTSDDTIAGKVISVGQITSFTGSIDGGTAFSLPLPAANGTFIISAGFMNQIAGGTLADGAHNLVLHVTGTTGSTSTSVFLNLKTAGPIAPAVHLDTTSDPSQDGRPITSNVSIQGTTSPGAVVTLFSGTSTASLAGTTTADASGSFSFNSETLVTGPNDFTIVATDSAGNQSQSQATFVEDQAPTGTSSDIITATVGATPQSNTDIVNLAGTFINPNTNATTPFFSDADTSNTIIQINTSMGPIKLTLLDGQDPINVRNFLDYIQSGGFNNSIFHRLFSSSGLFIIQGGGFTFNVAPTTITPIPTGPPIANEFPATVPSGGINTRGTLAMAKGTSPNSATSQFFFNLSNNTAALDSTSNSGGFPIFANVADGYSQRILDLLSSAPTQDQSNATGAAVNAVQTVTVNGNPTGGTFTLSLNGVASAPIAFNATASQVQAAVAALPSPLSGATGPIGAANVNVTLSNGVYTITFAFPAPNAGATVPILSAFSNLTGGISPSVSVIQTVPGQPTNAALGGSQGGIPLNNYSGTNFPTDATASNFELVQSVQILRQTEFLTYTVTGNTNPSVASASILSPTFNNDLSVQFLSAGTTTITVVATDLSNQSTTTSITVTVSNPTPPLTPNIGNQVFTVAAGSADGTVVGTVLASDPNPGKQVVQYNITGGNTNNAFGINVATGQITVLNQSQLNIAANPTFNLTVQAINNASPATNASATITINLVADTVPTISNQTLSVAEGSAIGTVVGNVAASAAHNQSLTYAIIGGNAGGTFTINSTGTLSVADNTDLVMATNPSIPVTIQVTDNNATSLNNSATVTVNVTANSAPIVAPNQVFNVVDSDPNGTVVGTLAASDPDAGQTLSYSLNSTDFAIDPVSGQITVINSGDVIAANSPFVLQATVTDNASTPLSSAPTPITIYVTQPSNQPSILAQTFNAIDGSPVGTVIGTVNASNPDGNPALTYAITGGNTNNTFQIDPNTGVISVANNSQLNIAVFQSFALTVQVTDSGFPHPTNSAMITINLQHNTAPQINAQNFSVAGGSAVGSAVGTVLASDSDPNQTVTYAITAGNVNNTFAIDPNTGIITVKDMTDLTAASSPFNLTVTVTDDDLRPFSASAIVTITVT
jgi:cyclophilin family peptidyl-prolyl cis-trans isomerase